MSDGRTKYYGKTNFTLDGEAKYSEIKVNNTSAYEDLKHAISIHQNGQTDYPTFCKQAADAGVEKWTNLSNRLLTKQKQSSIKI